MRLRKSLLTLASASVATLLLSSGALAAAGYTFFGDAQYVSPGNASSRAAQIRSSATPPGYGGVDFAVPAGLTVNGLTNLATDYMFTAGSCGVGAPRFQINVPETGPADGDPSGDNIFVYIGPPPSYTGCPPAVWSNTGNLFAPTNLVDATQLGGAFYDPVANVKLSFGSLPVLGIQVVTDTGYAVGGTQTVVVDNTQINATTITYEPNVPTSKDQCKKDGWQGLEDANGQPFKNQGQCVAYFNHN